MKFMFKQDVVLWGGLFSFLADSNTEEKHRWNKFCQLSVANI